MSGYSFGSATPVAALSRTRAALVPDFGLPAQAAAPDEDVLAVAALTVATAPPVVAMVAAAAVSTAARSKVVLRMVSTLSQEEATEAGRACAGTYPSVSTLRTL